MEYEDSRRIATSEGVELELPLAGLGSRFGAALLDALLKAVLVAVVGVPAALLLGGTAAIAVLAAAFLAAIVGYDVLFEVLGGGRTPGKRAAGLRVVRDGGRPVGLRASLVRNVLRLLEGLPLSYLPAMVSILVTRDNQRLGDLAAGTLVVREPSRVAPTVMPPVRVAAEEAAAWDVAAIGDREAAAVRAFLGRRHALTPAARTALASQLAGALRPRVAGTPAGLGDEAFLERLDAVRASRR